MRCFLLFFIFSVLVVSCSSNADKKSVPNTKTEEGRTHITIFNDTLIELTDLRRGDILIKPNHNWLPGTAWVKGGSGFGHAMIVVDGAFGKCTDQVMSKSIIFESHARAVPPEFELRTARAYKPGTDFRYDNISFGPLNAGFRFRLRPSLTEAQVDSVIAFIIGQDDGLSSWRAHKKYAGLAELAGRQHQTYWYCSHLIWQAFYSVLNIDLDPNGGVIVYPNDLIVSPYFQNDPLNPLRRVRF
jgi:hypothetical protein